MSLENKGTITNKVLVTSEPDRSGNLFCNGTSDETEINLAFTFLTSGRTGRETVKLIGDFTIDGPILLPSFTILDLTEAHITLANGSDANMIDNADQVNGNVSFEIIGGILDANGSNQAAGIGIFLVQCDDFRVTRVTVEDAFAEGIYTEWAVADVGDFNDVSRCTVTGCATGFKIWHCKQIRVSLCTARSNTVANYHFAESLYNIYIGNHAQLPATAFGFRFEGDVEPTFIGNSAQDVQFGIWGQVIQATIIGNQFNGTSQGGIFLNASSHRNTVVGNECPDSVSGNPSVAFDSITIQGDDNVVANNFVHGIDNWRPRHCINIEGDNNLVEGNNLSDAGAEGIHIEGGNNNLVQGNRVFLCDGFGIEIDADADDNKVTDNYTSACTSGGMSIANSNCSGTIVKNNRHTEATKMVDSGTDTIYDVMSYQFTEPVVGVIVTTSPTGVEVDVDTEQALAWGQIPREVQQVMRIKIWAVATDGPINAGGQMHLEITFNAGASNAAYNEAGKSWNLVNFDGEEADYVANDVVHWVIIDGDVGTELTNLVAGDSFEIFAIHEAGDDPDGATDALFRVVEVEYV